MGFCYGCYFIMAGGFLLLITTSQEKVSDGTPYKQNLTTSFTKTLQWWRVPLKSVCVSTEVLFFESVSQRLTVVSFTSRSRNHEHGEKVAPILFV